MSFAIRGMASTSSNLSDQYPLHWIVWHNHYEKLREVLSQPDKDTEKLDSRGRTVLHLAVSLGHIECARLLLHNGANVLAENKDGWSVLHEAISTGDPEMVALILQFRDYRQACIRLEGVPKLLNDLRSAPDFYVEMRWEFTSWIPLLSKVCPSDVCKIWKRGSCIRVDTTLLGFDNMSWKRGNRSFVFKGCEQGATLLDINHDAKEVVEEVLFDDNVITLDMFAPAQDVIVHRLTHPVVCTHLNVDTIQLELSTYGFLGWRSDRYETVNGHKAAVYSASNVEIVSKSRAEHVDDKESKKTENNSIASRFLKSFSGFSLDHNASTQSSEPNERATSGNPEGLSPEQYFGEASSHTGDIGRPKETSVKVQKFKGCLWMCKDFPLSLTQQVLPIIDLMSTTSPHFQKLSDFIKMKLPAGFPVKIEIPVFHVLNACVTFDNINGMKGSDFTAVPFVSQIQSGSAADDNQPSSINVEAECFQPPAGYQVMSISNKLPQPRVDEDDRLLQLAIQESLMMQEGTEDEQVTLMEALSNTSPGNSNRNQNQQQDGNLYEDEFEKALRLSVMEADRHKELEDQENEELQRVLELSMVEK